jgi:hypothetical protein
MRERKLRPKRPATTCQAPPKPSSKLLRCIRSGCGGCIKVEGDWVHCAPTTLTLAKKTNGPLGNSGGETMLDVGALPAPPSEVSAGIPFRRSLALRMILPIPLVVVIGMAVIWFVVPRVVKEIATEGVPTGKSNWLTVSCESADNRSNERSLPIDLVRDGRTRPIAGSIASRNPSPSTSAQCTKAQIAEASARRQHRSTAVCRALLLLPQGAGRSENPQARDGTALAQRGFPDVVALEVTAVRRAAKDARGHSPAHSRDERCQPTVGTASDSRRAAPSSPARLLSKILQ